VEDEGQPGHPAAIRLIFEYEGDEVRLVSQQPVDVAVTGFDVARVARPGHYVETRSAAEEPLSRVRVREAFGRSAEVFPEEPGGAITRVDVEQPRGAFTVVVPAPAEADHVAVVELLPPAEPIDAREAAPARAAGEVVEMGTFPLDVRG
jgi:hypothetical protein